MPGSSSLPGILGIGYRMLRRFNYADISKESTSIFMRRAPGIRVLIPEQAGVQSAYSFHHQ